MADIARIKGNIAKMIAQNAPEQDIDAYVSSEGVSLDDLRSGPKPDKYQQAAIDEQKALKDKGIDPGAGYTRRIAHGATFGADNTVLAALSTPFEMMKRSVGPVEGYNYAKAREDKIMDDARENTGALGTVAEIAGGAGAGLGLARNGITFARNLAPNAGLLSRSLASAGDSALMSGVASFNEGNGIADRLQKGGEGLAIGGVVGGVAPGAQSLLGAIAGPVVSNITARINPERFARSQVSRAVSESGMTPGQIAGDVGRAANEGQGMFTLADALGNPGQRMLSTTTRAPGQARTDVVNFLEGRQAGQGRRVANTLAEGFDSPQTGAQVEAAMTTARDDAANTAYGTVRRDAQPVDVSNVVSHIDDVLRPYGVAQNVDQFPASIQPLATLRRQLTSGNQQANDFNFLQNVRSDLSDEIQMAVRSGAGKKAGRLGGALRELDTALESSSPGFRQANRDFAQASRDIEAVGQGRQAASRGRTEDVIPAFRLLSPRGQTAFRAGYVDPLIENAQGAPFGANKARPLTSDAFGAESSAIAPGHSLMNRRIDRENTMFQTRNAATGNSKTVENLADDAAMGIDPTIITQVASGNWGGALRSMLGAGQNMLSGNTPEVRQRVADILLSRGQNITPRALQQMLDETMQRLETVRQIAQQVGRGASGGVAVAPSATGARR